jgi:hypothetical protein
MTFGESITIRVTVLVVSALATGIPSEETS